MSQSVRSIAAEILVKVDKGEASDLVLEESIQKTSINPLDKRLLTELVYGTLRWRQYLDENLRKFSDRPLHQIDKFVLQALRVAAYQLLKLDKIPESAAVDEAVKSVKGSKVHYSAGFVNGVLRNLSRSKPKSDTKETIKNVNDPNELANIFSHPKWMIERWQRRFGVDQTVEICRANNFPPPTTLRVNFLETTRESYLNKLKKEFKDGEIVGPTKISNQGIMLKNSGPIKMLPGFNEGLFVIQDESSQLVARLLDPKPGEEILDICAAPGGKTTHLAELMENKGQITACDISPSRLELVKKNALRLKISIIKTKTQDAKKKFADKYDRILLDAPCTGSGVIRRHPEAKWNRIEAEIPKFRRTQISLLKNAASSLKDNGVLVYSVCSINPEECEEVIYGLLETCKYFEIDDIKNFLPASAAQYISADRFFRSFPTQFGMDGFFMARLKKSS